MSDVLLQISQKIINLFDMSIVIFEKKRNTIKYISGNEFFITNNKIDITENTTFQTIFPKYSTTNILDIINNIGIIENSYTFVEEDIKIDIYAIDPNYIVVCTCPNKLSSTINSIKTKLLLNNMNHAIRTPLNSITGLAELLLQSQLSDEQYNYIHNIRGACFALINVITDLLDFIKLETRNLTLSLNPFNLDECLQSCINMVQHSVNEKNLHIHLMMHPNVHQYVIGDMPRVKQIILNLLDNAIKFTNQGYIKIEVLEDPILTIKISDSGIGMTEQEQNRVFGLFDKPREFKNQSIGLGIPITKYLIDLMDGTIDVISKEHTGSVFTIRLPLKHYETITNSNKTFTILILHTDHKVRINISKLLIKQNIIPILASSLLEAKLFTQESHFDIIISNTLDFVHEFPNIPKILLGSYTNTDIDTYRPHNLYTLRDQWDFENLKNLIVEILNVPATSINYSILNVEDNEINRVINERMLETLGFQNYKSVTNGLEAYQELISNSYDILLLDIKLPHKSGLEVLDDLAKQDRKIPYTIIMTAYVTDDVKQECTLRNVNDILYKPIDMQKLLICLKRAQRLLT